MMDQTEIYLIIAVTVALLSFLYILLADTIWRNSDKKEKTKAQSKSKEKEDVQILEVFDYLGTKIIHENGKYTVNHEGKVHTYNSWIELAPKFQKMVKELDSRSQETKASDDYFLETINGNYYLTYPGGKKKRYKSLSQIPANIRKAIGK